MDLKMNTEAGGPRMIQCREDGEALVRGECVIEGCGRLTESKGLVNGKRRYTRLCSAHRDLQRGKRKASAEYRRPPKVFRPPFVSQKKWLATLDMTTCSICSWQGPCDKHRIKHGRDGGKYHKGNVMVVCPNCHRLIHTGKMRIK